MKRIIFTVTNDLTYDQRMHRICHSLAAHGYDVLLVGRKRSKSVPLTQQTFGQKRLTCFFTKGVGFYAEYNIRLFLFLLFHKSYDAICSIDLDTLPAGYMASIIRGKKRVFDSHEYFTEVPELVGRSFQKTFWEQMAKLFVPQYKHAYTVGPALATIFSDKYGPSFKVVRKVPENLDSQKTQNRVESKFILYQGALNDGRGVKEAILAMKKLDNLKLLIAGEGDLSSSLRALTEEQNLSDKVEFLGYVLPIDLKKLSAKAWIGLNLLENKGLSYYYSLANKFFDYVQASVPVLTMNFPEYSQLNKEFKVAYLIDKPSPEKIASAIKELMENERLYHEMQNNCDHARKIWNWENEERILLKIWSEVFSS
ncbi:MAG: glycosyltransferase [Saprospiraceae bacterium]